MNKTNGVKTNEKLSILDTSDSYEIQRLQDAFSEASSAVSSNALFASIYDNSPDVTVFALDTEYRYLNFNEKHLTRMQLIWGKKITAGVSMLEIIGNLEDWLMTKTNCDRALSGERFTHLKFYGDEQLTRIYYWAPITRSRGSVIGLSCFALNLTDQIQANEASLEHKYGMTGSKPNHEKI